MSQVSTSPSTAVIGVSARPERRDIGLGRRYAAERRFSFFGMAAIGMVRSNTESSLAHLEAMLGVKSVSELFELQTAFLRKQAEVAVEQAKTLSETSKKVAEEVAKPGKAAAEKAMSSFKLSA